MPKKANTQLHEVVSMITDAVSRGPLDTERKKAIMKDIQEKFSNNGFAVEPGTPDDLARRNRAETAKWEKAIRDAKIEPQ